MQQHFKSSIKSIFFNIIVVFMSIVATLVFLEIIFRVCGISPIPKIQDKHIDYEKNSKGLRDYEYDHKKKKGIYRIVAVGDSLTYGFGVSKLEDIFLKRLEKKMNNASSNSWEVINGAFPGYDTKQEYNWLKEEGVKYSPDLIIVVYFFNDATEGNRSLITEINDFYYLIAKPINYDINVSHKVPYLYKFFKYRIYNKIITNRTIKEYYRDSYFLRDKKSDSWEKCKDSILAIKKLAQDNNSKLLFVIFPLLYDLDEDYCLQDVHDIVSNFLKENDVDVFSLLPTFISYKDKPESLWVNSLDAHPNEKAHEMAANSLYNYLIHSGLFKK